MLTLYQYPPAIGLQNPSPFCLKLETWLRMAGLTYEVQHITDPNKGPKGKLPFIRDDDLLLGDSHLIIRYLAAKHAISLDNHLTVEQRATARAFAVMLEEHYYWAIVYNRWVGESWPEMREELMRLMPPIIGNVTASFVHKQQRNAAIAQGLGRHSPEELYRLSNEDMQAIARFLGRKSFLMGDKPATVDATLYGMLANVLDCRLESPLHQFARSQSNLVAYNQRMRELFFARSPQPVPA